MHLCISLHLLIFLAICWYVVFLTCLIFISRIILYTIVVADYDQEKLEVCKDIISTKSGINRLALYHSSIGRSVLAFFTFKSYLAIVEDCSHPRKLMFVEVLK